MSGSAPEHKAGIIGPGGAAFYINLMPPPEDNAIRKARAEAREAISMFGRRPPAGNPYRYLPLWAPFWAARLVSKLK